MGDYWKYSLAVFRMNFNKPLYNFGVGSMQQKLSYKNFITLNCGEFVNTLLYYVSKLNSPLVYLLLKIRNFKKKLLLKE